MNVGILTYHNTLSYGAHLQALGLQEVLRALGHRVHIIDYRGNAYEPMRVQDVFSTLRPGGLVANLNRFLTIRGFSTFNENLSLTHVYSDDLALRNDEPNFSAYVVGSDQIWQLRNFAKGQRFDLVYFLDFVTSKARRIAYAPSFGRTMPKARIHEVEGLLRRFDALSAREKVVAKELSDYLDVAVHEVCDPTILFGRSGFDRYLRPEHEKRESGVFYFSLKPQYGRDRELIVLARRLFGAATLVQKPLRLFDMGRNFNGGPFAWIEKIRSSSFVLTNSYHGTIFSILYHKPFLYLPWEDQGQNFRVQQLLAKVGLESRYLGSAFDPTELMSRIANFSSWGKVDEELEEWRAKSLLFLSAHLR